MSPNTHSPVLVTKSATKTVAIEEIPPLVFPGQKAEIVACPNTKDCHHCNKPIAKGMTAVVVSRIEGRPNSEGDKAPTFTFCSIDCERQDRKSVV